MCMNYGRNEHSSLYIQHFYRCWPKRTQMSKDMWSSWYWSGFLMRLENVNSSPFMRGCCIHLTQVNSLTWSTGEGTYQMLQQNLSFVGDPPPPGHREVPHSLSLQHWFVGSQPAAEWMSLPHSMFGPLFRPRTLVWRAFCWQLLAPAQRHSPGLLPTICLPHIQADHHLRPAAVGESNPASSLGLILFETCIESDRV